MSSEKLGNSRMHEEEAVQKDKYPKSVLFILGNEFCERFCYYGMRTVLTIYLTEELLYSDSKATMIFHAFVMLSYFSPLFGAVLADSLLGKFKTILYISIVYAIGNIVLSVGSIPSDMNIMKAVSLLGLLTIGIGTGGIKPCVSAFGGDQFTSRQEKQRQKFFSIFYFAINSGSVVSTLLTPILRADVHCFGGKSCYPLAYGVPAVLMLVALALFLFGKPLYVIRPAEGNIFGTVLKCIFHAIRRKARSKDDKKKEHWLDYADDKFDKNTITDIRKVLYVLWIFLPAPVFWALFDQTGSSWTLQAKTMDGEVLGYHIKPDQMQVANAIMIIVMIPLFDYAVYPLFSKCNLLKKPLQRMAIGGFLSALSFVMTGFIELNIESGYSLLPETASTDLTIINNSPCNIQILVPGQQEMNLNQFEATSLTDLPRVKEFQWEVSPSNCSASKSLKWNMSVAFPVESMMITVQDKQLQISKDKDSKEKSKDGDPKFRIFFLTDYDFFSRENSSFKLGDKNIIPNITQETAKFGMTEYYKIPPGKYNLYLPINETDHQSKPIGENTYLKSGGTYILSVYQSNIENITQYKVFPMAEPNSISILYQIPCYIVLTAGEIMWSITGLEFSYSQAPQSMKSIVQASWLLTVAFGNLLVMIIAKLSLFERRSYEMFMFAVLMGLDMLVFSIMAYYYKSLKDEDSSKPKVMGKENAAYENETDFNK